LCPPAFRLCTGPFCLRLPSRLCRCRLPPPLLQRHCPLVSSSWRPGGPHRRAPQSTDARSRRRSRLSTLFQLRLGVFVIESGNHGRRRSDSLGKLFREAAV
jgi:hypothetical protein